MGLALHSSVTCPFTFRSASVMFHCMDVLWFIGLFPINGNSGTKVTPSLACLVCQLMSYSPMSSPVRWNHHPRLWTNLGDSGDIASQSLPNRPAHLLPKFLQSSSCLHFYRLWKTCHQVGLPTAIFFHLWRKFSNYWGSLFISSWPFLSISSKMDVQTHTHTYTYDQLKRSTHIHNRMTVKRKLRKSLFKYTT